MTIQTSVKDIRGPFGLPTLEGILGDYNEVGTTLARVAAGLFLMPHGAQKLFGLFGGYGLEATGQFFANQLGFSNGYLAAMGAGSVEFFAGLALTLGLFTRSAAIAITVMLLVASQFHIANGFFWTDNGWEYPILWAVVAFSFALRGGGHYSVDRILGIKY
ncbi:DoxX family protein [Kordiimonas aestuarii]|uniref:DoxX family protein n=1 Tax=Kordiimonas aestuarii TaxID=1005925 RepID=UPI0021D08B40|nr:DoxX family protein [Kordiimonas aestuarii]